MIRGAIKIGQTIHSVHDADGNRIAEYDYDPGTQISTLLREYVWMKGENVAVVEGGLVYYVRTDHIGRPVFATDDSGTKVWEASYLPFGGVHTSTGANSDLRFPGQWFQSEAGLHQNWMRDYDPTTGRYIQADPLGLVDGASVYGYALQNPMRYTDPTGEAIPWGAVIVYSLFVANDILHHEGCLTPVDVIFYMLINLDPSKKVKAVRNATRGVRGARSTQKAKKEKDKEDKNEGVDPHNLNRTHPIEGKRSSKRVDRIADSMRENGYQGPPIDVVRHKGKDYIVDGHHRAAAARRTNTPVNVNVVTDISGHPSNYNSVSDVLDSAANVGPDRLRPPGGRF